MVLDVASIASLAGFAPETLARVTATTAKMGRRGEKKTMITDAVPQIAKFAEKNGRMENFAKKSFRDAKWWIR